MKTAMSLAIVDTSIFVHMIGIPKIGDFEQVRAELQEKIAQQHQLFLPMATVFETGNHIAQNGDGRERRTAAERFTQQVRQALDSRSPFTPMNFPSPEDVSTWLDGFPEYAMQEIGLGDVSIIQAYKAMARQFPQRHVYIWSKDQHLASYEQRGNR